MSSHPGTFPWEACAATLRELHDAHGLELEPKRRFFTGPGLRIHPPLVFPIPVDCHSLLDYLDTLPAEPGRHTLVLLQAGAASLGLFEAGEESATKSFKRYVVRGKGRAQPTHLQAKGKSRYGSRLRLQNAQRLLDETSEKLGEWWQEFGPSTHVYYNAPVRLWPSLFQAKPAPPFAKDEGLIRIPLDLPRPTTDVLLRTYRRMGFGRIEQIEPDS